MRKEQSLHLAIPTPCNENWDKMTPTEKGRHCAMCNKTVVDFSLYTDRELVEFFKKATGNVCGRAHSYQLNRDIIVSEPVQRTFLHKLFWGTAFAGWFGFGATSAHAQCNTTPVIQQNDTVKKDSSKVKQPINNEGSGELKVHLIDKTTKQPLPFANVVVEQNGTQVNGGVTDIDGIAVIKPLEPGNYTVKAVFEGYNEAINPPQYISSKKTTYLEISLKPITNLPTGIIVSVEKTPFATTYGATYDRNDIRNRP
jgi:hypothetical protein